MRGLRAQAGKPPFNPRAAVSRFALTCAQYGVSRVTGDRYAGETFRQDFQEQGISYELSQLTKSQLYDALEPRINAGEVELLDIAKLQEQLLGLVIRGQKIDHLPGEHDDFSNACAGALWLCHQAEEELNIAWIGDDSDLPFRGFEYRGGG